VPPLGVTSQAAVRPPEWPDRPQTDADQVEQYTASICSSEEERDALAHALTLRAWAMVNSGHFKALHRRLAARLLAYGELYATDVRVELQRAELNYQLNTMEAI
jgi:hypothetical protein